MTIKMTPTHWFCIAGAGGLVAVWYVGFIVGDASDGLITVPPQINSAVNVWLASCIAVVVILAGIAKLIARWIAPVHADLKAIRHEIALLEPTQQLPLLRVVGTAAVAPSAEVTQHAEVTAIGARIARRLAGPDEA